MDASSKEAIAKAHSVLIPAAAAAANDAMPNIREAALQLLTTFAMKAGSMKPVDKVGNQCSLDRDLAYVTGDVEVHSAPTAHNALVCEELLAVMQYAEKLDEARKKKLEEMIAAARSGKPQGGAPKAALPEKVGTSLAL